jgi:hypothetical protein
MWTHCLVLRTSTGWCVDIIQLVIGGTQLPRSALALPSQVREVSEREAKLADWRTIEAQVRVESEGCKLSCIRS